VKPEPAERNVKLLGQFDREPLPTKVEKLVAFANPVNKNNGRIQNENAHLTWYEIARKEPARNVRFENQFGSQKWMLYDAKRLLLPAEKKERTLSFPKELDHFVCYATDSDQRMRKAVTLEDQFDRKRRMKEEVRLRPAYFCVPVEKNGEPIQNPRAHLAVYHIDPPSTLDPPLTIQADDQFGPHKLTVTKSILPGRTFCEARISRGTMT